MQTILNDAHPTLTLMPDIKNYCSKFFKLYNLNYFQVLRVYQDGSFVFLSNLDGWAEFSFNHAFKSNEPLVYSYVNTDILDPTSYFFLWEENLPIKPVSLIKNEFKVHNGLTLVERGTTYYDMWGFGTPANNKQAISFYINNIDVLRNFINAFKHDQKLLLNKLESQPINVAKPQQDKNLKLMLLEPNNFNNRIAVSFNQRNGYITTQEYACISKLPLGYSSKQIGAILKISPRTVEEYFRRVKIRLGCKSKLDLIQLLSSVRN